MYLDYSKLAFDKNGTPETPTLVLKTMHEETIGVIPGVYNLKLSVKFAEPSEMTFDVPAILDGEKNWIYDELVGYKVIYTEHYGIYVVMNPTTSADGISDVKHVQCYSLEKVLDTKKFFLEDGDDGSTFKFFNQTNHNDPDTIIGRVLEVADGWHMGYVARLLPSAIVHSMGMTITLCPSCMATAKTSSAVCSCLTLTSAVSMSMTPISN